MKISMFLNDAALFNKLYFVKKSQEGIRNTNYEHHQHYHSLRDISNNFHELYVMEAVKNGGS